MSNSLQLSGTLIAGPLSACDSTFPAGTTTLPFTLFPPQKSAPVQTGAQVRNLQSPSAFVPLDGVGAGETLAQGNTLYLRTTGPISIRLTTQPTSGPDVVAVIPVKGLLVVEFNETNYLKLLEAQGAGQLEYYVSGNQ